MDRSTAARIRLTKHALSQMAARGVEVEDLVDALLRPEVVEPHEGRERYVRDGVAYVIAWEGDRPVLCTVLLRERRQWTDEDARNRR